MQSIEEKKNKYSVIKKTCFITNTLYLATHILYFILFLLSSAYIMVYINIASLIIYLAYYVLLYKQKYALFAIGCGIEICTHVLFATIYCGLESGFNWCLIGLCVICFFVCGLSRISLRKKAGQALNLVYQRSEDCCFFLW